MNATRPIILVRPDSDLCSLVAAVRTAVSCRSGQGLLLVEAPAKRRTGINRLWDYWGGVEVADEPTRHCEQNLVEELKRVGLRVRVEFCRELTQATIQDHARRFDADLVITERCSNVAGRLLTYLDEDTSLLADSAIPVWLCGNRFECDSPIVAAIDPAPETEAAIENNSRVIRTAFAMARKSVPVRKIHFLAICEDEPKHASSSARRTRVRLMNDLRAEIFRTWSQNSQCKALDRLGYPLKKLPPVPVQISMHNPSAELIAMTLDEIQPAVIVTGKPQRSAIYRFFKPGMLSTFSLGSHNVLTVTELSVHPDPAISNHKRDESPSTFHPFENNARRDIAC